MNDYQHLGLDERRQVYQLVATGRSVQQIAAALHRHRSTIHRELKRNRHLDDEPLFRGYFPTAAQMMADRRRVRGGKIAESPSLPPISPTACQQSGRRSRLQDIFDAIAVIVKPSVTRPSTSSSTGRTDAARACGAFLARNPSRHSAGVMAGIQHRLHILPPSLRQSITFDRGTEFAAFATLKKTLAMTSYFCLPSAPWQKGSVENSNGRIRRFLP